MTEIDDDVVILTGVISFIARSMGEEPNCVPTYERRIMNCQIAVALLSEACNDDPASIVYLVADLLKQPARRITIDSV